MGSIKKRDKQLVRAIDRQRKEANEKRKMALIKAQQEASKARRLAAIRVEEERRLAELTEARQRKSAFKRMSVKLCSGVTAFALSISACVYSYTGKADALFAGNGVQKSKDSEQPVDKHVAKRENTVTVKSLADGQTKDFVYTVTDTKTEKSAISEAQVKSVGTQKEAHTHTFGEWKNNGKSEVRRCLECGEMEFRNHSFTSWKAESDTQEVSKCSTCDAISHSAHTYKVNNAQYFANPSCNGEHVVCRDYECTTCGHKFQGWKVEDCTFGVDNVTFDEEYDYHTCELCHGVLAMEHKLKETSNKGNKSEFSCINEGCGYTVVKTNSRDDDDDYDDDRRPSRPEQPETPSGDTDRKPIVNDDDDKIGIGNGGIKDIIDEDDEEVDDQLQSDAARGTIKSDLSESQGIGVGSSEEEKIEAKISELQELKDTLAAISSNLDEENTVEKTI